MTRLGTPGLLARHVRSGAAGSLLVGLLVGVTVLGTALAPRALTAVATEELLHQLRTASPVLVDVSGSGVVGFRDTSATGDLDTLLGEMDRALLQTADRLPEPLASATGDPLWVAHLPADEASPEGERRMRFLVALTLDVRVAERVQVVRGHAPAAWRPAAEPGTPIEIALSTAAADATGLDVGDVLGFRPAPLRIAALYEPVDAAAPYWQHQSGLLAPILDTGSGALPTIRANAYIAPDSALALQDEFLMGTLDAWLPTDPEGVGYGDVAVLATQTRAVTATATFLPHGGRIEFRSGLPDALDRVTGRVTAVSALLALSLSGLLGVLLAVVALGIRSVIARRTPALSLLSARGASGLTLRGMMALEGALVALPPAALALLVGEWLLPGDPGWPGRLAPVFVAIAPIVLFAALASPRSLRPPRNDLRLRDGSRVRLVVEAATVGLAVVAVWLLARRGLVSSAAAVGVDPLLASTPLLLALAACVVALRVYPAPLLGVQRLLRRRGGAVGVLGAARAVRDPALGFATALALVVGVSIVVFSTLFVGTVRQGLERGARDVVGADLQVRAFVLDAEALDAARAIPGVSTVAALSRTAGVPFDDGARASDVTVVVADTVALHRIRPDIPELTGTTPGPGRDAIPVLVSEDWADTARAAAPRLGDTSVAVTGAIPSAALPGMSRRWVLVDERSADALGVALSAPERLLVSLDAGADASAVASALDRSVSATQPSSVRGLVVVLDTASTIDDARSPAISGVEAALLLAALASLALTMLAIVVASVSVATARNRLLGVLRVLGMSSRQLRGVLAWELGPLAVTAVVVGTGLGLGLAGILGAVLDLRPFVGGLAQPELVVDPLAVLVAVAAFLATVAVAGVVSLTLARRLAPAGAMKMGEA